MQDMQVAQKPELNPKTDVIRDPGWYWVRKEDWGSKYGEWTPALWKPESRAWYSSAFSGIPDAQMIVGEKLIAPGLSGKPSSAKKMLLGLDYDHTYSVDPEGWNAVVKLLEARGHRFVCVTSRAFPPGRHDDREPVPPMPVVCSGHIFKRKAALAAGFPVDVWIDDCPSTIEPGDRWMEGMNE